MKDMRAFWLEYREQGGIYFPSDRELHTMCEEFAKNELAQPVNFSLFARVWAACQVNEQGRPVKVIGLIGFQMRPDVSLARFLTPEAARLLLNRCQDYLHDNGLRGQECFVYVNPEEEARLRCAARDSLLSEYGAEPANRCSAIVR